MYIDWMTALQNTLMQSVSFVLIFYPTLLVVSLSFPFLSGLLLCTKNHNINPRNNSWSKSPQDNILDLTPNSTISDDQPPVLYLTFSALSFSLFPPIYTSTKSQAYRLSLISFNNPLQLCHQHLYNWIATCTLLLIFSFIPFTSHQHICNLTFFTFQFSHFWWSLSNYVSLPTDASWPAKLFQHLLF